MRNPSLEQVQPLFRAKLWHAGLAALPEFKLQLVAQRVSNFGMIGAQGVGALVHFAEQSHG
jgi:hypothetical protein